MQTKRFVMCLVALIGISSTPVQVVAQQGGYPGRPLPAAETINVDFSGGTLEDLLATIKGDNAVSINVVVSRAARQAKIPELDLRHVRVPDVMTALTNLGHLVIDQAGENIYSIRQLNVQQEQRGVQIYDIRALVTEQFNATVFFGVDDIVTAMTIAWDMTDEEGRAPSLKFHEETYLLVVYGNSAQQKIAKTVLERLMDSQKTLTREQERDRKIRAAEGLQQQVTALTMTVSQQELINRELEEELVRKIKSADKMHARAEELTTIVRDLEYNNNQLRKEIEALQKRQLN